MFDKIRKIFNHLLLNVIYISDIGLYFGKTGFLLFFAHYAKLTVDDVDDEIVAEIIDDIFHSVGNLSSMSIPDGVCGVGWGVEYILQNKLMEGDSDEILADLDKMIFSKGVESILSNPYFTDILRYIAIRLTSLCGKSKDIPFPRNFLLELYQSAKDQNKILDISINNDFNIIKKNLEKGRFRRKPIAITQEFTGRASIDTFPLVPLGLHNGLSGLGINLLLELQKNNNETYIHF